MDAPQQLAQYYMMVTCKWRLSALLCFLKTHAHQKVMVFFSTCDSVDFHALLFRESEWPMDLDAAIEGTEGTALDLCAALSLRTFLCLLPFSLFSSPLPFINNIAFILPTT
jgi:hypothetical protein